MTQSVCTPLVFVDVVMQLPQLGAVQGCGRQVACGRAAHGAVAVNEVTDQVSAVNSVRLRRKQQVNE